MITIDQIARKAGVSRSAVSHVINGRGGKVSAATRANVEALLREHRYTPNGLVRALKAKRTYSLGVLVPSVQFSFYASILEAMEIRARERGYHVFLIQTHLRPEVIRSEIDHLRERRVDGFIIVPSHAETDIYGELARGGEKVVFLDSYIKGIGIPSVDSDDYAGAALAAQHLLDTGRRRFVILATASDDRSPMALRRLKGFRDTLRKAGIPPGDIVVKRDGLGVKHGYACTRAVLESGGKFDAVLAFTDMSAVGAIRALQDASLSVPGDVAVIGYGNLEEGHYLTPPLSTIHQHPEAMGVETIDLMLEVIGSDTLPRSRMLPPTLMVRASSGGAQTATPSHPPASPPL